MVTKQKILTGVLLTLFSIMNVSAYSPKKAGVISGNSIKEAIKGFYETSSINGRATLLLEVLLGIVVLVVIFIIIKKIRSKKKLFKGGLVQKKSVKYRTDLDTLYEILKHEKEISIEDIEKTFKLDSDIAFEWSKILENGNLATIEYPRFGKPVLKLIEENQKVETEKDLHSEDQEEANKVAPKKSISATPKKSIVVEKKVTTKKRPGEKRKKVLRKPGLKHSDKIKKKTNKPKHSTKIKKKKR